MTTVNVSTTTGNVSTTTVNVSTTTVNVSSTTVNVSTTTVNVSTTTVSASTTTVNVSMTTVIPSEGGTNTTGTPMTATPIATTKATAALTSTTHNATNLSSAYAHTTSAPVATPTSMFTMRNASFSIGSGTEYSSADCESCSIGGTITVTMSCSIKINGSDDKKCDREKFKETSCDYVTLADKGYRCAEVENNYTNYVEKNVNVTKKCDEVCPASGSVLSPHIVFIFASGLVVGMLSQSL
ncbi:flocculation protein FLO11-like [Stylophora pistillata]|uniref:Uncharacterized protein n=1 Tax=Stylophora pistillata TaxID=50429 RepID=A0A2B4RAB4_STYPI|nr:flocculation protein FLO11-like [Stylophora pistillata]PFX14096.1 hypothetical protein AWC38_SpisGene21783 [Stylophora pistillata]